MASNEGDTSLNMTASTYCLGCSFRFPLLFSVFLIISSPPLFLFPLSFLLIHSRSPSFSFIIPRTSSSYSRCISFFHLLPQALTHLLSLLTSFLLLYLHLSFLSFIISHLHSFSLSLILVPLFSSKKNFVFHANCVIFLDTFTVSLESHTFLHTLFLGIYT